MRIKSNSKKGFSLVELIVVIAIMAVLVAVLAPALLSYVEKSRAQKDESAMGEVTNAVLLAMSDADVYDELLVHSITDNVSCYIDNSDESEVADYITVTKAATNKIATQYTFGDNARLADEKPYYAAGNMRGVTITFKPDTSTNTSTYVLAEGIINKFDEDAEETVALEDCEHLYNAVRATIGNEVKSTSQTYRNSEYTIFIKIGSLGGAQAEAQDAVQVYGQYNGTNLALSEAEVGRATAASVKDDGTIEQTPSGPVGGNVTMLEGNDQIFYYTNPRPLTFKSSANFDDFQDFQIDGLTVNADYYTVSSGSTIVTLDSDYIESYLCSGEHVASIVSTTGTATAKFTIVCEHDFNEYDCMAECNICGYKETRPGEHDLFEYDCGAECNICGYKETKPGEHGFEYFYDYNNNTCTAQCVWCGYKETSEHVFGDAYFDFDDENFHTIMCENCWYEEKHNNVIVSEELVSRPECRIEYYEVVYSCDTCDFYEETSVERYTGKECVFELNESGHYDCTVFGLCP